MYCRQYPHFINQSEHRLQKNAA